MKKIVIDHTTPPEVRNEYFQTYPRGGCSTSGIRGVHPTPNGKWRASYVAHGVREVVGVFDTKEEAREAIVASKKQVGLI